MTVTEEMTEIVTVAEEMKEAVIATEEKTEEMTEIVTDGMTDLFGPEQITQMVTLAGVKRSK